MTTKELIESTLWDIRVAHQKYKIKGVLNYILSKIDLKLRLPFVFSKPTALHIPVVEGICNLSCHTCFPFDPNYRKELSFREFKEVFDKDKYLTKVVLGGWGEPFMAKDIFKIIEYAKSRHCRVGLVTNMTLVNEAMAKKIVVSKLDYMGISMDAANPELFEKIRNGAKFKNVIDNLKTLTKIKRQLNATKPKLFFEFVGLKDNIDELPRLIELAHQVGVPLVKVNPLRTFGTGLATAGQSLTHMEEAARKIFSMAEAKARELGVSFLHRQYSSSRARSVCDRPWTTLDVRSGGTIHSCCFRTQILGKLCDGLARVWNSKEFRLIRKTVRREGALCDECLKILNQLELNDAADGN